MYIASFTGAEIASRLPVISADAIAPFVSRQRRADARVDDVAHAWRSSSRSAASGRRHRRLGDLDARRVTKPVAPMRWK